jgi:hypothetical protein
MIESIKPYASYFLFSAIALLVLYIRTLVVEKAKNRVLRKNNKELTEQTEQIKKDHQLDIAKRKYQYENKKDEYLKFYKLLDSFTIEGGSLQDKMTPILEEFNRNFLTGNQKAQNQATAVMTNKTQKLMKEVNSDLVKLKQETNTIRLIASDEVIGILDLLELAYENSSKVAGKVMNNLSVLILTGQQEKTEANKHDLEISAGVVKKLRHQLISRMRIEMNEI